MAVLLKKASSGMGSIVMSALYCVAGLLLLCLGAAVMWAFPEQARADAELRPGCSVHGPFNAHCVNDSCPAACGPLSDACPC